MAELDYAYLAEFAAVQDGKLTAVGASFTHVAVPALPAGMSIGIAGRIRAHAGDDAVAINIKVTGPSDTFDLEMAGMLEAGGVVRPYGDGKVGLLFALNTQIPLMAQGLYVIDIALDGENARRLAFDVETASVS